MSGTLEALLYEAFPGLEDAQAARFIRYYTLLCSYNERVNLTAITDEAGFVHKHLLDSALPLARLKTGASLIDVGTGAGFPGMVLRILRPDLRVTLLDSLNKRLDFLRMLCDTLGVEDVRIVHARAEDGARDKSLRGQFGYAAARAVAHTAFLAEWLVPFLRVGGEALLYKGPQAQEELAEAKDAFALLGCRAQLLSFPAAHWGERYICALTKEKKTDARYPRRAGAKAHL